MFKVKVLGSLLTTIMLVNFLINLKFKSPEPVEVAEENSTIAETKPRLKQSQQNRRPSSIFSKSAAPIKEAEVFKAEVKREDLNQSNFAQVPESPANVGTVGVGSSGGYRSVVSNYQARNFAPSYSAPTSLSNPGQAPKTASSSNTPIVPDTFINNAISKKIDTPLAPIPSNPNKITSITTNSLPTQSTSTSTSAQSNTCSANITGGSFSNPIGVTLNCTVNSTIKYCIGLDTGNGCCDPKVSATTYSTQIVVGATNGNYCLSYYGTSTTAGTTTAYQNSYTINSTLPNLQVSHPKIFYQTTELTPGSSFVTSTDFGKTGYGIGQINLKTHDPSPLAENLTCDQIVTNYVGLPLPSPSVILSLLDVSLDSPSVQIQIPYQIPQLDYGSNFITTYIENTNFVSPIYSCSTTNVTLSDFEFFQEELAFGDAGTNSVREFTGGLSSYGFFEDQSVVYRSPAGVTSNTQTGEKLGYGIFGIFY